MDTHRKGECNQGREGSTPDPAALSEEGRKANTYHRNSTVHVPMQDDKYFTRCSLYNITAETSNFSNYKSQFKKLKHFNFFLLFFGSLGACLVCGWAGPQHPSGQTHQSQGHSMIRSRTPVSTGSALVCFVFYEAVRGEGGEGLHNGEGAQEQLQKMSLYSAMINSKPTLSQDAGEHRILYGTS